MAYRLDELLSPFAIERLRASLTYGDDWLRNAPSRLVDEAHRFDVVPTAPQWGGNRSVACRGIRPDGTEVVVKLSAYKGTTRRETHSLAVLAPSARVPEVIAADPSAEVLITRLIPDATPLSEVDEIKTEAAGLAELLRLVHACDAELLPSEISIPFRLAAAWQAASAWRHAPRIDLARAAEVLELLPPAPSVALHGDLVPANVLKSSSGVMYLVDPQASAGDPAAAAASWGLLRGNGDELGWRAGGGAIRRALVLGSLLSLDHERVLAHLAFQALELACRQASWEQWEWAAESIELYRRARAALA